MATKPKQEWTPQVEAEAVNICQKWGGHATYYSDGSYQGCLGSNGFPIDQ